MPKAVDLFRQPIVDDRIAWPRGRSTESFVDHERKAALATMRRNVVSPPPRVTAGQMARVALVVLVALIYSAHRAPIAAPSPGGARPQTAANDNLDGTPTGSIDASPQIAPKSVR